MTRNIIAILRGILPKEIEPVVEVLLQEGINTIEVPLNSPNAYTSIERMCRRFRGQGVFGAGTVLRAAEVRELVRLGADMVVSPNCNPDVIRATKMANMLSYPGVMTPSECFSALNSGADGLKFFPGELIGPDGLGAMRAVFPEDIECLAVGGVRPENFAAWKGAGASGFGIGSALYRAGDGIADIRKKARLIVAAYDGEMQ